MILSVSEKIYRMRIYDISPTTTPFMSTVGRTKAKNTYHEWQTDSLADVNLDKRTS